MTGPRHDRLRPVALLGLAVTAVLLVAVWTSTAPDGAAPATMAAQALGRAEESTTATSAPVTTLPATTAPSLPVGADPAPAVRFDAKSQRYVAESGLFSVRYPEGWRLAAGEDTLTPNLGWQAISLGTFTLRPGGDSCANIPEHALEDMAAHDALVTLFVGGGDGRPPGRVFGPSFPPSAAPNGEFYDCLERDDRLDLRWGEGWDHGRPFYVLVAFGPEVSHETVLDTWEVLNSLTLTWPAERMAIQPRPSDSCEPPSPYDTGALGVEVMLTPLPLEAWALLPPNAPPVAGTEVPISWSVAAAEVTDLYFVHPGGITMFPSYSPGSAEWNPAEGVTFDTLSTFPEPGCWEVRIVADGRSLTGWLEVR